MGSDSWILKNTLSVSYPLLILPYFLPTLKDRIWECENKYPINQKLTAMKTLTLDLLITKENNTYKGSLTYKNNPLTQSAPSIPGLETQLKKLLWEFESLDPETVEFNHYYQCPAFFSEFAILNKEQLAADAGIGTDRFDAFSSGREKPSPEEAEKIENALKDLAYRLLKTSLVLS